MSKSTVQRALAESGSISSQAQQRIIDAARELGYQRDPLFSILGSRGRKTTATSLRIAYIGRQKNAELPWDSHAGVDVFDGAKLRGDALGYSVERVYTEEIGAGKRLMDVLYHRGFVGVLISQVRAPDHEAILANTHLPVVCCGRTDPLPLHTVQPDIGQMTRLAWRSLIQAGYRRIGPAICRHSPPVEDDADRLGVILQCQQETLRKADWIPSLRAAIGDRAALLKWFHRHRPEAVLGFSAGQYYVLKDDGIDMSTVGFASLHTHKMERQTIAGVIEPMLSISREALNLLDQLIRHRLVGIPEEPLHIEIPGRWIDGMSLPAKTHVS